MAKSVRKINGNGQDHGGIPYILVGWSNISRYCGVSVSAVTNWDRRHGFPVARLPDGRVAITLSLIDQWLMARATMQERKRQGIADQGQPAPNNGE